MFVHGQQLLVLNKAVLFVHLSYASCRYHPDIPTVLAVHPGRICLYPAQHQFVIAKAFYPLLLTVCHPVSSAYIITLLRVSDTLGGIIAPLSLNLYALRWRTVFPLTSELSSIEQ